MIMRKLPEGKTISLYELEYKGIENKPTLPDGYLLVDDVYYEKTNTGYFCYIFYNDSELFFDTNSPMEYIYSNQFKLIYKKIIDTSRWSIYYEVVLQHVPTGRYFMTNYSVGATEHQEQAPYEEDESVFYEVFPVEVMVTEYRRKENLI